MATIGKEETPFECVRNTVGGVRSKVFLKNWKHLLAKANRVLLKAEPFNLHILNTDLKWPVSTGVLQSAQQKVAARKESDPAAIDVPTQKFNLRPESMTKERVMPPDVVLKKATKVRGSYGWTTARQFKKITNPNRATQHFRTNSYQLHVEQKGGLQRGSTQFEQNLLFGTRSGWVACPQKPNIEHHFLWSIILV